MWVSDLLNYAFISYKERNKIKVAVDYMKIILLIFFICFVSFVLFFFVLDIINI